MTGPDLTKINTIFYPFDMLCTFKKRPFMKGTHFDSSTVFSSKDAVIKVSFTGKDANHTDPVTSPWEGEKKLIAEDHCFCLLVFISVLEVHNEFKIMSRKS